MGLPGIAERVLAWMRGLWRRTRSAQFTPAKPPTRGERCGQAERHQDTSPNDGGAPTGAPGGQAHGAPEITPQAGEVRKGTKNQPIDARGRRGEKSRPAGSKSRKPRTRHPQPELMCRKNGVQWEVFLSATDECQISEVRHGEDSLEPKDGEYYLRFFTGCLSITHGDGRQDFQLPLADDGSPLIFKLRADWEGPGRHIKRLTHGHFIVIAPHDWDRQGHVPVEPEDCTDSGFCAHYFHRMKDDAGEKGFKQCPIALSGVLVNLQGHRIFDDSDEGPLFGGNAPPTLDDAPGVVWARVGEEGDGGWRGKNFRPDEQGLAKVLDGRQGRFFVRVYDEKATLLDSDEFRYFQSLEAIHVNNEPYKKESVLPPSPAGHHPTKIRFVGADAGVTIKHPTPHATADGDCVVVHPVADADVVSCALESHVSIKLHLPRIWWRADWMAKSTNDADQWCDTPLKVTRQQFAKYADSGGTLHVRLPRWFKGAPVGFDDEPGSLYKAETMENGYSSLRVRLEDFCLHRQIDQRLNDDAFLCVEVDGAKLRLVRVLQDPMPKIAQVEPDRKCRSATPIASVKRCHGAIRPGRGFSHGELRGASMTMLEAKRLSVPLDKRRRTTHIVNTAVLEGLLDV